MESNKRMKGSAILDAEGLFIFTPYNIGGGDKNLLLVKNSNNASLWKGKMGYSIRIRLPTEQFPTLPQVVATLMELYHTAQTDLNRNV